MARQIALAQRLNSPAVRSFISWIQQPFCESGVTQDGSYVATSSVRILEVDDSEPFRRLVCSILQNKLELRTIVEASNGVDAIELAQVLQPGLILLAIGLPRLDGIEAARRIRELAPRSKILFVSQESSLDVVHAAFSAGASGYVVKMDVGSELPAAISAVLRGEKFVGSRFEGRVFTEASAERPFRAPEATTFLDYRKSKT
jgi:DNA-binding NarL/FixJ family response regulator